MRDKYSYNNSALSLFQDKIIRLIKEHSSIVWIKSFDKESIYDVFNIVCSSEGYCSKSVHYKMDMDKILTWSISNGRKVFGKSNSDTTIDERLYVTIADFAEEKEFELLILDDISHLFSTSQEDSLKIISVLQDFAYNNTKWRLEDKTNNRRPRNNQTIIIISPILDILDNLNHMVEVVEEPIPDENDIRKELGFDVLEADESKLLKEFLNNKKNKAWEFGRYKYSRSFIKDESNRKKLVSSLKGMHMYDIRKLLYSLLEHSDPIELGLNVYDSVSEMKLPDCVSDVKKRIVQNSGLLQVINIDFNKQKDRVGNIDNLREHLVKQKEIIDHIEDYNEEMPKPKGILLVGAPGCGKSEAAKSVAAILEKPLLRLDIGALMGQYVGVSEHNLIEAIKTAEAAQPCVLWIDEIEKAFAGFGNSDSGNDITVMRMVGYFLTWMQERKSLVYLVATANNLDNLRPELLRKGRWDKIMYLSYPKKDGIVKIFLACLRKYKLLLDIFEKDEEMKKLIDVYYKQELKGTDLAKLVNDIYHKNNSFKCLIDDIFIQEMSGADIDSLVIEAYSNFFVREPKPGIKVVSIEECQQIVSAANTLQSRVDNDKILIEESLSDYKIRSGHFEWDMTRNARIERRMNEYKLSSGDFDDNESIEQRVEDVISDIKISSGNTYLSNETEIKRLIKKKIEKQSKRNDYIKKLIEKELEMSDKEKDTVRKAFEKQLSHKGRDEQERYYRSKGYESAS